MIDILQRLANSHPNEGSHDLQCRCFDAAAEISRLRATNATICAALTTTSEGNARLIEQRDELMAAAKAVIDRWDSPLWKAPATGEFINRLRKAIAKAA